MFGQGCRECVCCARVQCVGNRLHWALMDSIGGREGEGSSCWMNWV